MSLPAHFDRLVRMVGVEVVDASSASAPRRRQPLFRGRVGRGDPADLPDDDELPATQPALLDA